MSGNIELNIANLDQSHPITVEVTDNAYKSASQTKTIGPAGSKESRASMVLDLSHSFGWYDFSVRINGSDLFERRYAGRVETGKATFSDPAMGGVGA